MVIKKIEKIRAEGVVARAVVANIGGLKLAWRYVIQKGMKETGVQR